MDFDGNFLLRGRVDIAGLKRKVLSQTEEDWNADPFRQQSFAVHRATHTINVIYDRDFRHENPTFHPKYEDLKLELLPIFGLLATSFADGGSVVRCLLTRLAPDSSIPEHRDGSFSLEHSHRIHLPIITNDRVRFSVGGEEIHLGEGEIWEINNMRQHAVKNDSDVARVHLILDWAIPLTPELRELYERNPVTEADYD